MDKSTVKGVVTESKSGRMAIKAERVIDCTGRVDIAKVQEELVRQGVRIH